tara:strand:+ start:1290 stop:1406 length:117 start_codon:yes stop_codon:yes gene_type:complete
MSKNSPKQRLITFKNWLSTVKPMKVNKNKKKKLVKQFK